MNKNYWTRKDMSRRRFVGTATATGIGIASLSIVGCGDDDDGGSDAPATTNTGTSGAGTGTATTAAGAPKPGGVFRQAETRDVAQFDPHSDTHTAGRTVAVVHAGLLRYKKPDDPNVLEPEAYMAASWEPVDDTTVTFKLKPGVKFHDAAPVNGRAVTAEDVKFSFERIKTDKPEFQRRSLFAALKSVDAVDAQTVRFNLSEPLAPLIQYVADTWQVIIPKEVVEAEGDMKNSTIGAGPYTLEKYDKGVGLRLNKWEGFWGEDGPYIDDIELPIIPDPSAALAAFRSGELTFLQTIPWSEVPALKRDDKLELKDYIDTGYQYIRINTSVKPLDDVRVRQAISLAMNREAVSATAFQGNGVPHGVFPAGVKWALQPKDLPHYTQNVKEAKVLLEAAGYGDGFEIENLIPSGTGRAQDMAAVVSDQLRQVNIKVNNRVMEYGAYLQAAFAKDFALNVHWGNKYGDPDGYAQEFLVDGSRNFGFWGSAELDAKILKQRRTLDADQRRTLLEEIQKEVAENMYAIGIANFRNFDGWYKKLNNFMTADHTFLSTQLASRAWISE